MRAENTVLPTPPAAWTKTGRTPALMMPSTNSDSCSRGTTFGTGLIKHGAGNSPVSSVWSARSTSILVIEGLDAL